MRVSMSSNMGSTMLLGSALATGVAGLGSRMRCASTRAAARDLAARCSPSGKGSLLECSCTCRPLDPRSSFASSLAISAPIWVARSVAVNGLACGVTCKLNGVRCYLLQCNSPSPVQS